jgi:hypothetical protein
LAPACRNQQAGAFKKLIANNFKLGKGASMLLADLRFKACTFVAGKFIELADVAIDEAMRLRGMDRNVYRYDAAARFERDEVLRKFNPNMCKIKTEVQNESGN